MHLDDASAPLPEGGLVLQGAVYEVELLKSQTMAALSINGSRLGGQDGMHELMVNCFKRVACPKRDRRLTICEETVHGWSHTIESFSA